MTHHPQNDILSKLIAYDAEQSGPSVVDFLLAPHHGDDAVQTAAVIYRLQPRRLLVGHRVH